MHGTPLVDQADDRLCLFVLIGVHHETAHACRCLPVDGAKLVATHIIPDLLKLRLRSWAANALCAFFGILVYGSQFEAVQPPEGGIDLYLLYFSTALLALHEV